MTTQTQTFPGSTHLFSALTVLITGLISWAGQTLMATHDMALRHEVQLSIQGRMSPSTPDQYPESLWVVLAEQEERNYRELLSRIKQQRDNTSLVEVQR
ncbi:hypothetical protein [Larsenimonas suaedae]|uniref:Uncharacterized protein n=1 Tax=Larsenimonas suaedae TaxID=1851019 RepID=A0ABU1GUV0_9GAMM|nr:hypothetical protein [Larsenimonas suaedae]MCM2971705.1 hypothetical protein [Larsenimonas suaedae]MDR5895257.1 hypothetical protein [Larsenimonas suaedae]